MHKGIFITFEGIEGSGKSTQIKLAFDMLVKLGHQVILTKEPGGTCFADKIRKLLLDPHNSISARTELLLMLASRAQHVEEKIKKELHSRSIVLCDRFSDSSLAYQGYGRGLPINDIETMNSFATGNCMPDLTILIDIDPEKAFQRISEKNHDRFERESITFYQKVRNGYLELAKKQPLRIHVFDGSLDIQKLHTEIINLILKNIRV